MSVSLDEVRPGDGNIPNAVVSYVVHVCMYRVIRLECDFLNS